jgi:phosphatidylglycerophosphatase A
VKNFWAKAIATSFGAGFVPIAPGTAGTAVTIPLAWALADAPLWAYIIVTIFVTLVGVWAAHHADILWGTHDCQKIVIDETAGYLVTMLPVDKHHWPALLCGFVAFRIYDQFKPFPARRFQDKLPGGWGVVLDDVAAGVWGAVTMILLDHFGALDRLAGL